MGVQCPRIEQGIPEERGDLHAVDHPALRKEGDKRCGGARVLDLEDNRDAPQVFINHFVCCHDVLTGEGRAVPRPEIERAQLRQRVIDHRPVTIGVAVHEWIVEEDERAIRRYLDIRFDSVGVHSNRPIKGGAGILRRIAGRAAMRDVPHCQIFLSHERSQRFTVPSIYESFWQSR